MNDPHEQADSSIHNLIVQSFAQSRIVASSIRVDVLPALQPTARIGADRLLRAISKRRIFDDEALVEIKVLIERIAALIAAETEWVECWDNDHHDVSGPSSWTEARCSETEDKLGQADRVLRDLERYILAVLDHRYADAAAI